MNTQAFIRGMGSVLEVFPSNRDIKTPFDISVLSDEETFRKDLEAVGNDFKTVIGKFNKNEK
jgi:hypothetical protein